MSIKTRILISVLLLELLGYGVIVLIQSHRSEEAVQELRELQVEQVVRANLTLLESMAMQMERNVQDLSLAGGLLYKLVKDGYSKEKISEKSKTILVENFESFPESIGGGLWYEPYTLFKEEIFYGPYAYWHDGDVKFSWDLNTPTYNYHQQSWYQLALPPDWDRTKPRPQTVYWTPPYYDEAGSFALMMTVNAIIYGPENQIVGLATVDWALDRMTSMVEMNQVTPNAQSFIIDTRSKKFVSYTLDPGRVMSPVANNSWENHVLKEAFTQRMHHLDVEVNRTQQHIYFQRSRNGLIYGVMVPESDMFGEVWESTRTVLGLGILISLGFIGIMMLLLRLLFKPFTQILKRIQQSIEIDEASHHIEVRPIPYTDHDEFEPLIDALNNVYSRVNTHTHEIEASNEELLEKQHEFEEKNHTLEECVKERTQALQEKTQQCNESNATLTRVQKEMMNMEKHAALGQLVAGVAHEINTPLGVGVTATSYLKLEYDKVRKLFDEKSLSTSKFKVFLDQAHDSINIIETNLERATELISQFKQVAVDQSSESMRCFEMKTYVQSVINSLMPEWKHRPVNIQITGDDDDIIVTTCPGAIGQVLSNFVMNSLKHGYSKDEDGQIQIDLRQQDGTVTMTYSDNGHGMSQDTIKRLFEPFFTTARDKGGSGLGMHIVYNQIAQKLQGTINVESELEQGVTFQVIFPAHLQEEAPQLNKSIEDQRESGKDI
ncbi:ATP-binding protein [Algicola sagamiensis]|uniref:ATP-binding protein n=1 Tax=Algicola sagamiensis TaxID=163869 RepID=UPI000365E931|nr:ATP-binding protein [Algicola sagamiensis]